MWMGYKMYEPIPSSEVALRFVQSSMDERPGIWRDPSLERPRWLGRLPVSSCLHLLNLFTALGSTETYVRVCLFRLWCSVKCRRRGATEHLLWEEPITWSLQLHSIFLTAFSKTILLLVWIYRKLGLPTRAHRPVKISTWMIPNFTR